MSSITYRSPELPLAPARWFRDVPRSDLVRGHGRPDTASARLVPGLGAPLPDLVTPAQLPVSSTPTPGRRPRPAARPHLPGALSGEPVAVDTSTGPARSTSLNAFGGTGRATGALFSGTGFADGEKLLRGIADNAHEARIGRCSTSRRGFRSGGGSRIVGVRTDSSFEPRYLFHAVSGRPRSARVSWPWRRSAAQPRLLLAAAPTRPAPASSFFAAGRQTPRSTHRRRAAGAPQLNAGLAKSFTAQQRALVAMLGRVVLLDHPQLVGGGEDPPLGKPRSAAVLKEDRGWSSSSAQYPFSPCSHPSWELHPPCVPPEPTAWGGLTGVIVHDRYQNYDSAELGVHTHQLCCAHLLRDLADCAETYPDAAWP